MLHVVAGTSWHDQKPAIIQLLKEYNIDVEHQNNKGDTPIARAVTKGHASFKLIDELIKIGAEIPTCPAPTISGFLDRHISHLKDIETASASCSDEDSIFEDHSSAEPNRHWFSKCVIECQNEYSMTYVPGNDLDQEIGTTIVCGQYGNWQIVDKHDIHRFLDFDDFTCAEKSCDSTGNSPLANMGGVGTITCDDSDYGPGTTCSFECLAGYYLVNYDSITNPSDSTPEIESNKSYFDSIRLTIKITLS